MVKKGGDGGLITKIADLVRDKKITGISDIHDHSDRRGMRLVIELKRDADPEGRPQPALQAHADADDVRRQHGRARRRRAEDAVAARGPPPLRPAPARGRRPPREVRAARGSRREVHILEGQLIALDNLDEVIALIRAVARPRRRARRSSIERFELTAIQASAILDLRLSQLTALEADKIKPGARRHRWSASASCARCSATSRRCSTSSRRSSREIARALRRRAPHADRRLRGRDRHRGPHPRAADGRHDHQDRLHQVAAARHLPPAAPRRPRRDRDGHEGRRLHRAPLRVLDARLPAVLLQPRQGLPVEGLRAAARCSAPRAAARSSTSSRCARASASSPCSRRATSPRASTSSSRRARASVKKTEFLAYNTPIKADGIIAINIRDDDELVAVRRTIGRRRGPHGLASRPGRALPRGRRCARWAATRRACAAWTLAGKDDAVLAMDVARDDQELLVVTENGYGKRTPIDEYRKTNARRQGRQDDHAHRGEGRPRRRARRARARGPRVHLGQRHGPAHRRARHQPLRPAVAGRARS